MEDFAWYAFMLNGNIEAYLLHLSLLKLIEGTEITDGKN